MEGKCEPNVRHHAIKHGWRHQVLGTFTNALQVSTAVLPEGGTCVSVCTGHPLNPKPQTIRFKSVQVCTEAYGCAPDVIFTGDVRLTVPYIPAHCDYMLYELLKNAMRATVEHHRSDAGGAQAPLPPVLVHIAGAPQVVLGL